MISSENAKSEFRMPKSTIRNRGDVNLTTFNMIFFLLFKEPHGEANHIFLREYSKSILSAYHTYIFFD